MFLLVAFISSTVNFAHKVYSSVSFSGYASTSSFDHESRCVFTDFVVLELLSLRLLTGGEGRGEEEEEEE